MWSKLFYTTFYSKGCIVLLFTYDFVEDNPCDTWCVISAAYVRIDCKLQIKYQIVNKIKTCNKMQKIKGVKSMYSEVRRDVSYKQIEQMCNKMNKLQLTTFSPFVK
jgi:hypothetical protein